MVIVVKMLCLALLRAVSLARRYRVIVAILTAIAVSSAIAVLMVVSPMVAVFMASLIMVADLADHLLISI